MSENRCVCCGAVIPEGTMVCQSCMKNYWKYEDRVMRKNSKRELFERIMNDWVIPLGLFGGFIAIIIYILNT